jgi:hypothetical protein
MQQQQQQHVSNIPTPKRIIINQSNNQSSGLPVFNGCSKLINTPNLTNQQDNTSIDLSKYFFKLKLK